MTKHVSAGPWGHVKVTVTASPAGDWAVLTWVNGIEQMPIYGLDRAEALDLAIEIHDNRVEELQRASSRGVALQDVVEALSGLRVTADKVRQIHAQIVSTPGLDPNQRIALAKRLAEPMHRARMDLERVRSELVARK